MITVTYDQEVNMTYVKFKEGRVVKTEPFGLPANEVVMVDFNAKGWILGIEYDGRPHELAANLRNTVLHETYASVNRFLRQFYG